MSWTRQAEKNFAHLFDAFRDCGPSRSAIRMRRHRSMEKYEIRNTRTIKFDWSTSETARGGYLAYLPSSHFFLDFPRISSSPDSVFSIYVFITLAMSTRYESALKFVVL